MNASQYLLFHGGQKSTLMTFDTTKAGSAATHLILPFVSTGTYACTIFWGDGTSIYVNAYDDARLDHTYGVAGTYDVEIVGQCWGWRYADAGDRLKITAIKRWGTGFRLASVNSQFQGCANMVIQATDVLDLTGMTSLASTFRGCTVLNSSINMDTSNITNMSLLFYECSAFNSPVPFNTINVNTMSTMFYNCSAFNQPLPFSTSKVVAMDNMIRNCGSFNQDLSGLDVHLVTTMANMLNGANALSTANYDALLIAWAAQTVQPNVNFHAGDATYTGGGAAEAAHDVLTGAPNLWTITDGGGI